MFTGIIEETGVVESVRTSASGVRLSVLAKTCARGLKRGDSLAVNGCCLTVIGLKRARLTTTLQFDLLQETWQRTNLQFVRAGSLVNLERPLSAQGRLDGHFVTGHIDGLGTIRKWEARSSDWLLEIHAAPALLRYIVFKGSIAIDGISLTVAAVMKNAFRVWIIPHTREVTALRTRQVGDAVNLETDILGKYVERFIGSVGKRGARTKS